MIDLTGQDRPGHRWLARHRQGLLRDCWRAPARASPSTTASSDPWAELLVQRIEEDGGEAFALGRRRRACREEAEMMVDETVDRFGGLDILVNNAGIWKGRPIEEISDGEWNEMIGVNLTGTFHMIRAAVPHMKAAGGGRIINISSTAGPARARRCTATTRRPRAR